MTAEVICFSNLKGGTGKTTSCLCTYSILTQDYNKKVLLIDLAPQNDSSSTMKCRDDYKNSFTLMTGVNDINEVIHRTDNGFVIPSKSSLSDIEKNIELSNKEYCLAEQISKIKSSWDYILIDCPAKIEVYTIAAMIASDKVVVPSLLDQFSLYSLDDMLRVFTKVKLGYKNNLKFDGILFNEVNERLIVQQDVLEKFNSIACYYNIKMYDTIIRKDVTIPESQVKRQLLHQYDEEQKSHAYKDFSNFVKELICDA